MPAAKCTPGQDGTEAIAPYPVLLVTESGDFDSSGSTVRGIDLISNTPGEPSSPMTPDVWTSKVIVARLPEENPSGGTGDDETFTVRVTTRDGTIYEATPVYVTALLGNGGYPPTHDPATGEPLTLGDRIPT